MKLDIGEAIENGFERTLTRSAAYLTGIFFVINLISMAMGDTALKRMIESGVLGPQITQRLGESASQVAPLATGLSTSAASAITVVAGVLSAAVTVGAIRLFLSEEDKLKTDLFTENIGWILLNIIAGGLVFAVAVAAGFIAFIIPGFFLLSALYFWNFYVIDKNVNFVEGMKSSWKATEDNRLRTLGLIFIVSIATVIFSLITGKVLNLIGGVAGPAVGAALASIPTAIGAVFSLATFTEAYKQLRDRGEENSGEDESEEEETEGSEEEDEENSESEEEEE